MDAIYVIIILCLVIILLLVVLSLIYILKKTSFLTDKEKEFIVFLIEMFQKYKLNIDLPEEDYNKISIELNKIKEKHLKNKAT